MGLEVINLVSNKLLIAPSVQKAGPSCTCLGRLGREELGDSQDSCNFILAESLANVDSMFLFHLIVLLEDSDYSAAHLSSSAAICLQS